ncbi:MAG: RNA-binding domain-containing protein [Chloroflexota bacterium]
MRFYVRDTRNVLLLRVPRAQGDQFLITLAYALQRGIQFVYQVEEGEVAVELIGQGEQQRLLLWEAAEGGTGVWERMVREPDSFAAIAREALRVCHFDPASGSEEPKWMGECAVACYDCLLSYSNQPHHPRIDRHLIRDFLLDLTHSEVVAGPETDPPGDHFERLLKMVDPASPLEREFLLYLREHGLRPPNTAQNRPSHDVAVQPDFYCERGGRPGICVFIDGAVHQEPEQAEHDRRVRDELEDHGFRIIAITGGQFAAGIRPNWDVFGGLPEEPKTDDVAVTASSTIEELLRRGESETLEFKSSLRLGVSSGTVEPVVEKSILKTVSAFLNSYKGGTLIIGVEDNGNILGCEYDFSAIGKKQDLDGYELHLRNLLNREFGSDSAPLVEIALHAIDYKHVCEVRVGPGRRPYTLIEQGKDGQKKQQLYIRTGNQTVTLGMEEALRYFADRWTGN